MIQKVTLLVALVVGCHSLLIGKQGRNLQQCPDAKNTDSVLFWGMLLDGKDHSAGKGAYDWHGFDQAYKALQFLLTENPEGPLEYEHLIKARHICCDDAEGKNFGWAKKANHLEPQIFKAYTCLECDHMKALMDEVPRKFFNITKGSGSNYKHRGDKDCPKIKQVRLLVKSKSETVKHFKQLIDTYNSDIEKLTDKKAKLARLATYLKDFAFLHPWGNGNGRFRTMQLIHEVRRLGLGCGTLMYNNNKDLYYITKETYIQKIEEGIAAYEEAMKTGKSPWLDAQFVAKHKARFNPKSTMPGLIGCKKAEYKTTHPVVLDLHERTEELSDEELYWDLGL